MAILEDDEVNEQEVKMEDYIKKIVENILQEQLKEHQEIASIAKTKIAEMTIELQKIKELEKATTEYKDNMNTIINQMITNIENYNKTFSNRVDNFSSQLAEKLKEVKNTNQIFDETLKKSGIIENLNNSRHKIFEKFSDDIATKTNNTFDLINDTVNKMKSVFYVFVFSIIVFLIFSGIILYKTNNRVASVEESLNTISSSLTGLVKGDLKFWYSEEDKKAELDKVINEFSKVWAINVIADDKMPKDDEGLKALTGFDNNEKLASTDGFNYVWSYMNKAEGLTGEDQDIYDKLYEDLDNVKKSIKVAKPLSVDGESGAAAKFDFDTKDIYGKDFSAKEYLAEHEYTIMNVWGTFCGPCKAEMPDLAKVYEEYKDKIGFLGIVSDVAPEDDKMSDAMKKNRDDIIALGKRIIEDKGCNYPNLIPTQEMNDKFLAAVTGYPTTFVLDKEGNIVGSPIIGAQSYEGFKELCEQFVPKEMK